MRPARPCRNDDINNVFSESPGFRRLRSWVDLRSKRAGDADAWVFENWLNLPRVQRFRECLVDVPPQQAIAALLDMIRLAAISDPPGHLNGSMLVLRGRVLDDYGLPTGLLLGAMLTAGMVRYIGRGFVKFSAPEMVTFAEQNGDACTNLEELSRTVAAGPFMAAQAVACRAVAPTVAEPTALTLATSRRDLPPQNEMRAAVG